MKNTSINISDEQYTYIENHPKFSLSKFVRLLLSEYIELNKQAETKYNG